MYHFELSGIQTGNFQKRSKWGFLSPLKSCHSSGYSGYLPQTYVPLVFSFQSSVSSEKFDFIDSFLQDNLVKV